MSWSSSLAKRRRSTTSRPSPVIGPRSSPIVGRPRARPAAPTGLDRRLVGPALLVGILAVAVVGVVVVGLFSGGSPRYSCAELLQPQQDASPANPIVTPNLGRNHVPTSTEIEYAFCPPASGPHLPAQAGVAPLPPRFYDADARVGPGNWVHNLEHGYVVALYRYVDGVPPSDDQLAALRTFVQNGPSTPTAAACGYHSKVLAVRFDDMATPFALLAWDRVLLLDDFDPAVAQDFAERWIEAGGPEATSC